MKRFEFMLKKLWGAFKWLAVSGVATYTLIELSKYVGTLELAKEYSGVIMIVINTLLFAIAKFVEGEDK